VRIGNRIGRPGRAALLVAVGAAGGGAALAVASVPDGNGVVHACYGVNALGVPAATTTTPNVRIVDPSAGQTCATTGPPGGGPALERTLSWNTAGPQGPQGLPGTNGTNGPQGPAGGTNTVAAGHTLTISGGQVITVGGSAGLTIAPPTLRSTGPRVADVVLQNPRPGKPVSFNVLAATLVASGASSATGGGGAGKVRFGELQITKVLDKSSPALSLACASGHHFSGATVVFRKAGKGPFLVYTLKTVTISSYQVGPSGGGGSTPQDTLTLSFGKISIK
jgi:type VI secretion system (T6SS) effector Hcp